jgi:glycosidase
MKKGTFYKQDRMITAIFHRWAVIALAVPLALSCTPEPAFRNVPWSRNANIYEVNIRQFSEEGTFKAFESKIPELRELGVGILWLMPIHPIGEVNRKGTLGSYYAVKDYFDVNPEFGTKDDFRSLVATAHANGMAVILDWVANHTAWDNPIAASNPEFFEKDSTGAFTPPRGTDWSDVIQLDYRVPGTHDFMASAMRYWVEEFDIDGYRCDVADMVPIEFWNRIRVELDAIKPVFMLAEAENPAHHVSAFDMSYAWEMHHTMNRVASGENDASAIFDQLDAESQRFPAHAYRMLFTSNHDENSWNGTEFERLGDGVRAFAVLSSTLYGMPLVYNGQEYGNPKALDFFEKDLVQRPDTSFFGFYRTLLNLNRTNHALFNGRYGGAPKRLETGNDAQVVAFVRESGVHRVVVIVNLSPEPARFAIRSPYLNGTFSDAFSGSKTVISGSREYDLSPWDYIIYVR